MGFPVPFQRWGTNGAAFVGLVGSSGTLSPKIRHQQVLLKEPVPQLTYISLALLQGKEQGQLHQGGPGAAMSQGLNSCKDTQIVKPVDRKSRREWAGGGKTHHVFPGAFQHLINFKMLSPLKYLRCLGNLGSDLGNFRSFWKHFPFFCLHDSFTPWIIDKMGAQRESFSEAHCIFLSSGMAGTIYFLADLLVPTKAKFPAFEL